MFEIIFEDSKLRVINKPSGINSVSKAPSIESLLKEKFCNDSFITDPRFEAGIAHRLDFETSGALLAAKDYSTWEKLRDDFKHNRINKTYLALVEGRVESSGSLTNWIGGRYRSSKKVSVYDFERPRSQIAKLTFQLIKFDSSSDISALSIDLITGVRHQIRAQFAKIGHPLVGDKLYGSKRTLGDRPFFLHAKTLLSYSAPVPLEFQRFFI